MEVRQITSPRGGRKYEVVSPDGTTTTLASVTTILGALPKGGLDWWGFKLGVQAMQELAKSYDNNLGEDDAPGYLWDSVRSMSLDDWYAEAKQTDYAPHKALKKAAGRGTDVHALAEVLLRDGKLDALPAGTNADQGYVDALLAWHDGHNVDAWDIVAVEARMYSVEYGFAGTADLIGKRPDGVYVVGDLKTSKGIYESHHLQATAYAHAAKERGLVPADAVIEPQVIRLGIDGSYEVQRSRYSIEDFAAVKKVHDLLKDKTKKGVKVDEG